MVAVLNARAILSRLQEERVRFPTYRHGHGSTQFALGRPPLHHEHRLRLLLLCAVGLVVVHDHFRDHACGSPIQRQTRIPVAENHYLGCPGRYLYEAGMDYGEDIRGLEGCLRHSMVGQRVVVPCVSGSLHRLRRHALLLRLYQDQGIAMAGQTLVRHGQKHFDWCLDVSLCLVLLVPALASQQVRVQRLPSGGLGDPHLRLHYPPKRQRSPSVRFVQGVHVYRTMLARDLHLAIPRMDGIGH